MVTRSGDALGFTLASRAMNNNDVTELSPGPDQNMAPFLSVMSIPAGKVDSKRSAYVHPR